MTEKRQQIVELVCVIEINMTLNLVHVLKKNQQISYMIWSRSPEVHVSESPYMLI